MNFVMTQYLKLRMSRDEKGISSVEYAILLALVAATVITASTTLGTNINSVMASVAGKL